jgi:hypothetical protein
MRCVLRLTIVLLIAIEPTAVFAESFVCHAMRRGESAAQAARRITGDSRNAYQAWFQIRNASSRSVPKSQYDRVRAGWSACAPKAFVQRASSDASALKALEASSTPAAVEISKISMSNDVSLTAPATAEPVKTAGDAAPPASSGDRLAIGNLPFAMVWLGAAMLVPWFGWRILDDYLAQRKTAAVVMRHFADRFVSEFERPLVRFDQRELPVRSRIRWSVRPNRFDILLAPGEGRRYPNLADHKKNVEYDVARVMDVLADRSFVRGPIYRQAEWVVVPFQFKAGPKQTGVTCISSF